MRAFRPLKPSVCLERPLLESLFRFDTPSIRNRTERLAIDGELRDGFPPRLAMNDETEKAATHPVRNIQPRACKFLCPIKSRTRGEYGNGTWCYMVV